MTAIKKNPVRTAMDASWPAVNHRRKMKGELRTEMLALLILLLRKLGVVGPRTQPERTRT